MRRFLLFALFSVAAFAADVTGTWNFNVETDAGSGTPTFVLKQSGEELSGTYSGALGEAKVKGTVKGDKVEITFEVSPSGDAVKVIYTGTLDGEKKMKGTVKLGSLGEGTFTAQKN
jgi:cytochrome c-type biogenesis protein CcmE